MAVLVYHGALRSRHKHALRQGTVMRAEHLNKLTAALLAFVLLAVPAWPNSAVDIGPSLRSTIPAGYLVIRLQPSGAVISLLSLIECPEIKGARQVSKGLDSRIVLPDGNTMQRFPRHFSFR